MWRSRAPTSRPRPRAGNRRVARRPATPVGRHRIPLTTRSGHRSRRSPPSRGGSATHRRPATRHGPPTTVATGRRAIPPPTRPCGCRALPSTPRTAPGRRSRRSGPMARPETRRLRLTRHPRRCRYRRPARPCRLPDRPCRQFPGRRSQGHPSQGRRSRVHRSPGRPRPGRPRPGRRRLVRASRSCRSPDRWVRRRDPRSPYRPVRCRLPSVGRRRTSRRLPPCHPVCRRSGRPRRSHPPRRIPR